MQQQTLDEAIRAIGVFLEILLPDPSLAPALEAELAQACAADFNVDPWPAMWELLQDHGYAWSMLWDTAPDDVAYGLRVLWESYGLPALPFSDPASNGTTTAEQVVRDFNALAQTQNMTLAQLYEDSDFAVLVFVRTQTLELARRAATAAEGALGTF
jgi:hypothetical protein